MDFHNKLVFVPGKPFQPSAMFAGMARATRVKHMKGAPLLGSPIALPTGSG